ncbi:hypothetical protein NLI96_g13008 [Meripilus lineatus]|uniref:Zn(2)-C6 fungal-type domain-containing protein n=1 Tax=Meripilus lineatus TaxID=2056292 RepID=A0AAD5UNS0_9APHY|nr:hypothetical protein NLI96_g13008 [Physisporinus lineatus]
MASEPSKSSATVAQDPQGQPHPIAPYPPQFAGAHYPPLPPGAYPPYYAYAPIPTDGSHDPSAPNGVPPGGPYLMAFPPPPPGMVYAYAPPPGQLPGYPPFAPGLQTPVVLPRPKRKQVKMACTNCASACKRCDDARPCERCQKYGIADSCVDGIRKERKKGIKRGPYKRKNKVSGGEATFSSNQTSESSETTIQPMSYPAPPEGYYPYYYPHPGFVPVTAEGQANGDTPTANGNAHPPVPPHPSFYSMHPAVFPPYPPYAHAGPVAFAPPPMMQLQPPPSTQDQHQHSPSHAKSTEPATNGNVEENGDSSGMSPSKNGKKKRRASKGDENGHPTSSSSKGKKTKNGTSEGVNGTTNGVDGQRPG